VTLSVPSTPPEAALWVTVILISPSGRELTSTFILHVLPEQVVDALPSPEATTTSPLSEHVPASGKLAALLGRMRIASLVVIPTDDGAALQPVFITFTSSSPISELFDPLGGIRPLSLICVFAFV